MVARSSIEHRSYYTLLDRWFRVRKNCYLLEEFLQMAMQSETKAVKYDIALQAVNYETSFALIHYLCK
jgi:hypothetical protein